MENASKALIIAGAILLSILIIGLGMAVYNNAKNSAGNSDLSAQEIRAHNSQFLAYEGKQKGAEVKSLITAIKNNNATYQDRMIKITDNSKIMKGGTGFKANSASTATDTQDPNTDYTTLLTNIKNTTTYYVSFVEQANGCIGGVEYHIWSNAD